MQRPEIPYTPELPMLETPRLLLRPLTLADAPAFFAYASDPDVARTTTWEPHASLADTRAFIRFARNHYAAGEPGPWGLVLRADERVIGTCGLALAAHHCRGELGYALARDCWGQGLATEAAAAVVRYGFEALRLHRVEARCLVDNHASERVMQKLGMTYEGTLRDCNLIKGEFVTLKVYSVLRPEWEARG
jgi:ribosomal-protein-alanine N-acetyltransferase